MDNSNPLADLDTVDWSALNHAYGPAADVPALLQQLQSANEDDRMAAYNQLYACIYHQGSRYSASAAAVPFLYKLLNDAATPMRDQVVRLLTHLAIGDPSNNWLQGMNMAEWRESVADMKRPEYCSEQKRMREEWIAAATDEAERRKRETRTKFQMPPEDILESAIDELQTYDAVNAGLESILNLLNDESAALRSLGAYALAWFPEKLEEIQKALFNLLDRENNVVVQATAMVALGLLQTSSKGDLTDSAAFKRIQSIFSQQETAEFTHWASAAALLMLHSQDIEHINAVQRKVIEEEHLKEYEPRNLEDVPFPFADPDLCSLAALALGNLDKNGSSEVVKGLILAIPPSRGERTLIITQMALSIAFAGCIPEAKRETDRLTETQLELVRALTKVNDFNWCFANFTAILRSWRLPTRLKDLRTLAGLEPEAQSS